MSQLKDRFEKEIRPELQKKMGVKSLMAVPTLSKITLNVGLGEALDNPKAMETMQGVLKDITGQKPVITKSKKAISNFKIRPGDDIGLKVTLRREKMWSFIDKLINVVFPRVRDFRGVSPGSFDGRGNYTVGIKEHTVFLEIDTNKVDKLRGLEITIVTTSDNDDDARELLKALGFPFKKENK